MLFDIFFSISQNPVRGQMPSEAECFRNFFQEVEAADALGFGTAWIAESHLSSEVQKRHTRPVIPHWKGEVGLNVDFLQLAHKVFARTKRIEMGSAVMNILCNGGPVAAAERVAAFCGLHGLDAAEQRRIHVGFAAGRFEFMNRAYGIQPRDEVELAAWPALKGEVFREAAQIFVRLLMGEILSSDDLPAPVLSRENFRSDEDWEKVQHAAMAQQGLSEAPSELRLARRFDFEVLKIVPTEWRRELLQLVIGSHSPAMQDEVNRFAPVQVFNLSITSPEIIEATHQRMAAVYHESGGAWQRSYMPRTVFVFLNHEPGLSSEQRRDAANSEAQDALAAYWTALEGTIDPEKVQKAANNALVGNADDVAAQILERFHPDDRLMLWFDFFNHDAERVIRNMEAFMQEVKPRVEEGL